MLRTTRFERITTPVAVLTALAVTWSCRIAVPESETARFAPDGALTRPVGWETWVMVGASTGLSYAEPQTPPAPGEAPGLFHNIYLQPWAYRYFLEHKAFAQGTMFVMSLYEPSQKSSPAKAGFYEGDRTPNIEVHIKKADLDSTGWGFFNFSDTASAAKKIPGSAACYSCHSKEAAFDNAFTQFYPPLREQLAGKVGVKP